jgi:hypothetical protein
MIRRPRTLALALVSSLAAGCTGDLVAPAASPVLSRHTAATYGTTLEMDTATPHFLQPRPDAPAIANPVVSFWAKQGEDRRVRMYYHAAPGATDSTTFLELRVGNDALAAYPDGRLFARGDSVLITVTLVDAERLIVDCQPSGLRFSADDPATLKMSFGEADPDVNHDGTITAADTTLERTFRIWRRESPTDAWVAQSSLVELGLNEVRSKVFGFSGYAIAY